MEITKIFTHVDVPTVELLSVKNTVVMIPNSIKAKQSLLGWWEVNNPGWETVIVEAGHMSPTRLVVHTVGYIAANVCLSLQGELEKAQFTVIANY